MISYKEKSGSLFVLVDGSSFVVSNTDVRYKPLMRALKLKKEDKVRDLLNFSIPIEGIVYKNGRYQFKDFIFSIEFSSMLLKKKSDIELLSSFVNYFLNNYGNENMEEYLSYALRHEGFFLTDDGFNIVYNGAKNIGYPFLNIRNYKTKFIKQEGGIELLMEKTGLSVKSVKRLLQKSELSDYNLFLLSFMKDYAPDEPSLVERVLNWDRSFSLSGTLLSRLYSENYLHDYMKMIGLTNKKIWNKLSSNEDIYFCNQSKLSLESLADLIDYKVGKFSSFKKMNEQNKKIMRKLAERGCLLNLSFLNKRFADCKEFIVSDGYSLRIPESHLTLIDWSESLRNCIDGYFDRVRTGKAIVYGVFYKGKLKANIEIRKRKIVQFQGYMNKDDRIGISPELINKISKKALKLSYSK